MSKSQALLESLRANPFVLAPMAGITDHSFRSFMKEMGAGIVVTELISATGIEYSSQKTLDLMSFDETQRPVGIQLFGENPEHIAGAAKVAERLGADFIDLNFGCPVPKVVKKGAGSALLKDLVQLSKVIEATVKATSLPVTIKIRTGWDANTRNADEVCQIANDLGVTWVAIHGRTRAQGYDGLADWEYIGDVKSKSKIPVLGNGDILTAQTAVSRLTEYKLDGVLIGRGALKNPTIFNECMRLWSGHGQTGLADLNAVGVYRRLAQHIGSRCSDRTAQIQLKKFAAWFSTGYPGAAQLRKQIFAVNSTAEVRTLAENFFMEVGNFHHSEVVAERFLMGGHG